MFDTLSRALLDAMWSFYDVEFTVPQFDDWPPVTEDRRLAYVRRIASRRRRIAGRLLTGGDPVDTALYWAVYGSAEFVR